MNVECKLGRTSNAAPGRHIYGDLRVLPRVRPPRPPTPVAPSVSMIQGQMRAHSVALDEYYSGKNQRLCNACGAEVGCEIHEDFGSRAE